MYKENTKMSSDNFLEIAINSVVSYYNSKVDVTDNSKITPNNVYVVWLCKTLQNNKALLSTTVPDGMYYEVTWNGDNDEGYLDAYKKWDNIVIR